MLDMKATKNNAPVPCHLSPCTFVVASAHLCVYHVTQGCNIHICVKCMYDCVRLACRRALVSPVVKGVENLPDPLGPRRPLLFIGTSLLLCVGATICEISHQPISCCTGKNGLERQYDAWHMLDLEDASKGGSCSHN